MKSNGDGSKLSNIAHKVKQIYKSVSVPTYILVCTFGIGSWVAMNGVWAELPVLLVTQPECYRLATILNVIIQVANVGPLSYAALKIIWEACRIKSIYLEITSVFAIVLIGIISSVLLSFFWSTTAKINDQSYSVALIVLVFSLALVDCTSSVVFVPFMKHLPAVYLSALYIGEGLSGVLPSTIALIQGSVNNSIRCLQGLESYNGISTLGIRFSPDIYFLLLACLVLLCGLAFVGLLVFPAARRERRKHGLVINSRRDSKESSRVSVPEVDDNEPLVEDENREKVESMPKSKKDKMIEEFCMDETNCNRSSTIKQFGVILWRQRTPLVCVLLLSFMTNGALNAIPAFSFGSYSNLVLHLAINLGILANPIGALLYVVFPSKSRLVVAVCTAGVLLMSLYVIVVSAMSDSPPLLNHGGGPIIIIVNVILSSLSTYTKVTIAVILHSDPTNSDTSLLLNGITTQTGSLIGAFLFFFLVYYTPIYSYY